MKQDLCALLRQNSYPGRGILLGRSADGENAVIAYFIMGRSENSRNRVFEETGDGIRTRAYDESRMTDPSLIIYNPVRQLDRVTIVTNGDQTDTIYDALDAGGTFEDALLTRTFEPDEPNYTPRISGLLIPYGKNGGREVLVQLSILKSLEPARRKAGEPGRSMRFWRRQSGKESICCITVLWIRMIRSALSFFTARSMIRGRLWARFPDSYS